MTGLVINEKVNVRNQYYKDARAMTRQMVTGSKPFVTVGGKKTEVSRNDLRGMLSETKRIGFQFDKQKDKLPNFQELYMQFLDYLVLRY